MSHGFGEKIQNFFYCVLSKIGLEIMLTYALNRKAAFEDDKSVNFFQVQKIGPFPKGLTHGFGEKIQKFF